MKQDDRKNDDTQAAQMKSRPHFETEATGTWWPWHRTVWLVNNYWTSLQNYLLLTGRRTGKRLPETKKKSLQIEVTSISL